MLFKRLAASLCSVIKSPLSFISDPTLSLNLCLLPTYAKKLLLSFLILLANFFSNSTLACLLILFASRNFIHNSYTHLHFVTSLVTHFCLVFRRLITGILFS